MGNYKYVAYCGIRLRDARVRDRHEKICSKCSLQRAVFNSFSDEDVFGTLKWLGHYSEHTNPANARQLAKRREARNG